MMSRWKDTLCGSRIKNVEQDPNLPFVSRPSEIMSCEGKFYVAPQNQLFAAPFSATLTLPTGKPDFLHWQSSDQKSRYTYKEVDYGEDSEIPDAAMAYFENKYIK